MSHLNEAYYKKPSGIQTSLLIVSSLNILQNSRNLAERALTGSSK